MPQNNGIDKRVFLGGVLIVLGGIFLLNTMNILHFRFAHVVFSWPFILFVIGLFILINTEKKLLGWILTGIGALFLARGTSFPLTIYRIIPALHSRMLR